MKTIEEINQANVKKILSEKKLPDFFPGDIIKDGAGIYHEIEMSDSNPQLIFIPKNIPASHINVGKITAKILALTDISWKPDSNEMKNVQFDDYEWEKWFNS